MVSTRADGVDPHGREAESPLGMPASAWREILWRVWIKTGTDNIGLLAAGIAFYAFLSFVPLLGALVMTYGLIADPATIQSHMQMIIDLVPKDAAKLILDQLVNLMTTASGKKGLGLLIALLISIYGATRASGAIIMALNVVYEQHERRNILKTTGVSFVLIIGAVMVAIVGLLAASALALVGKLADGLGVFATVGINVATFAVAAVLTSIAIGACYRFAPDRHDAKWRWLSIGSGLATLLWLVATLGFGAYASTIGNYNATYGSLGAVVVLLMWLWVSAYAILLGAEINAEAERQTAQDTTTGRAKPLGRRGATVADEVAGEPGTEPSEEKSRAIARNAAP
ncbi:YihY/virulence factor BrkB family protein [Sphingomonas nostoxanthinifaciens]|uniref:YihY/virulence factor BrkB family protein n=1 Tax=Sphingomonas nostoxanthinifaciens TaxID=2872652 RepID=UPI001CC20432|nr:YihY/virulence factor BrkB family protein [Sphingomonas nostoxanthinifaciens]UAK24986.1 YihY/virulence factor BrkB family protein [Sphingomonas nostoxanthinifaciens]